MSEERIQVLLEEVLKDYSSVQINLLSNSARKELAKAITRRLTSKFYLVPLTSQETFE